MHRPDADFRLRYEDFLCISSVPSIKTKAGNKTFFQTKNEMGLKEGKMI